MKYNTLIRVQNEDSVYTKVLLKKDVPLHYNSNLVIRTSFSGQYNLKEGLDADFKDCLFKNVEFLDTSFSYDDFRSVIFYNAKFIGCDFKHSDIGQCSFYECSFIDCDISETASFEVRYIGSEFINCKFNRVIIRSARIHDCIFDTIECSNRLFEDCILSRTKFKNLSLKLSTIIYNYGITKSIMKNCRILDDDTNSSMNDEDIKRLVSIRRYTNLELFKLSYYISENLTKSDINIEELLTFQTFAKEAVNIQSLIFLSENLTEYFMSLYDENLLEVYYLLKLSYIFNAIIKHHPISEYPESIRFQTLCWQINLILKSYLDFQYYITENILKKNASLTLVTHDNLNKKTIDDSFSRLSKAHGFQYKIIARNSPYFIEIVGGVFSFVILMLNCLKKLNFELVSQKNLIQIETKDAKIKIHNKIHSTKLGFFEGNRPELEKNNDIIYQQNNSTSLEDIKNTIDITSSLIKLFDTYLSSK